jgi:hypothetical protein
MKTCLRWNATTRRLRSKRCTVAPMPDLVRGVRRALLVLLLSVAACDDAASPADAGAPDVAGNVPTAGAGGVIGAGGMAGAGGVTDAGGSFDAADAPMTADARADAVDVAAPHDFALGTTTRKLDLLFVIDNSAGMAERQMALSAALPALFQSLSAAAGGPPDLHLGVISSNVGAGPTQVAAECPPGGDRGHLQVLPNCGLIPGAGDFIRVDGSGNSNIVGGAANVASVAACMARLGSNGCGYEHQLLSMYFALDGKTNVDQNAFLREDAALAIILLSDEDDCSGAPSADFFADVIPGQTGSLRCSLKGHLCGGKPLPATSFTWPLSDCAPYVRTDPGLQNSRLVDVAFFVDFIKSNKPSPDERIFVGSIFGWSDAPAAQYELVETMTSSGTLIGAGSICDKGAAIKAAAGIRLHAFTTSFSHNVVATICQADLSGPLAAMGTKIADVLPPF